MIKISKMADYSVVTLSYMARNAGAVMSVNTISELSKLPEPTVSKILKLLLKTNLIESKRGINGGYFLVKDPADISMNDIISAIDGDISITQCASGRNPMCNLGKNCSMRGCWSGVNKAIEVALSTVSLADMILSDSSCHSICEDIRPAKRA